MSLTSTALTPATPSLAAVSSSYTFAFHDADVADVAEAILGRSLGLTYAIDPDVTGKISFRIDQRLTPEQLLQAFESTLALDDIALVKKGSVLTLEKRAKAKGAGGVRTLEEGRHAIGFQTLAVPLSFASPSEVAKALEAVGAGGTVSYVNEEQSLVVLGGTAPEIEAALQTIKLFDRTSVQNSKIRFFPLEHAPAQGVADELTQLLHAGRNNGVTLVPMKRLNGLFAFSRTEAGLEEVGKWLQRLDVASEDKANTLWVFHPLSASADSLKTALSSILGQGPSEVDKTISTVGDRKGGDANTASSQTAQATSSTTTAITLAGGEAVRIGMDKDTNTLLVSASASQWLQIQKLLRELDRPPGQIMIEARIVEITLSDDTRFGVDITGTTTNNRVTGGLVSNAAGTVGPTYPGFTVAYFGNGLKAAVEALGQSSRIEVVSAPKIMALDNKTATLDVGDQVPVVSQSAQSTATASAPLVNTVDYKNTGVILKVTPRISGGNAVILEVSQEVSSVGTTTTSGIDSPTILQRRLESSLVLNDGQVVALGGLISSSRAKGDSGVPYLKNIPLLGALFKTTTDSTARTELVVLLTAHILHDQQATDRAMADLLSDLHELNARGLLKH